MSRRLEQWLHEGGLLLGCSFSDVLHFEALVAVVENRVVDADFVINAAGNATAAGVEALRLGRFEVEIEFGVAIWFTIQFDLHRIDPGSPGTGEDRAEIDVGSGLADGQLELVEGPWRGTSCPANRATIIVRRALDDPRLGVIKSQDGTVGTLAGTVDAPPQTGIAIVNILGLDPSAEAYRLANGVLHRK